METEDECAFVVDRRAGKMKVYDAVLDAGMTLQEVREIKRLSRPGKQQTICQLQDC